MALNIFGQKKFTIDKNLLKYDEEYSRFYYKCRFLQEHVKTKYNVSLNCRQLDNLLIFISNENIRKY